MSSDRISLALEDILKRQADCLRNGDIEGALAMAPGLERLAAGLAQARARREAKEALARVQGLAERNAELIDAARAGVRAARDTLARDGSEGFEGYDAMGRPQKIGEALPRRR